MSKRPEDSSAEELLEQARSAWRDYQNARSTISRLGKYNRMNPGMAADYSAAMSRSEAAHGKLRQILGGERN